LTNAFAAGTAKTGANRKAVLSRNHASHNNSEGQIRDKLFLRDTRGCGADDSCILEEDLGGNVQSMSDEYWPILAVEGMTASGH